jgi:hypothetical protein
MGQWSAVLPLADKAVNAHVLPTGKVIYWPSWFGDASRLWDPVAGSSVNAPLAGYNIFCPIAPGPANRSGSRPLAAWMTSSATSSKGRIEVAI